MTTFRMLLVFLATTFALAAGPAQAEIKSQWVEYAHGSTKLKAYMVYDDKITGKRPAVLMIHAREGMTPKTQQLAETWAKLGYVTFAADIFGYGEGVLPKDVPEMQAQTAIYAKDRSLMRARTQAGFDALLKQPMVDSSKIALIGYCFGGAVGVEFGSTGAPLVANVAIHGSFRDHAEGWAKNVKGMFLILHGAEDEGYPLPTVDKVVQELRAAKTPFQLEVYSGTGHGFSTPKKQGRGTRQRAIDCRDGAYAQGAFRYLIPNEKWYSMSFDRCICCGDDSAAAKNAIRKAGRTVELVDESHFMASIQQCGRCAQHFLTLFCKRVDWADGDDPQTWIAVPVEEDEVQRLRSANVAADENVILEIIAKDRRFLNHDMPKGAPDRLEWRNGPLFIPGHD